MRNHGTSPRSQALARQRQAAFARERAKCLRCNGARRYHTYRHGEGYVLIVCPVCNGTGREPGR